jgi:hypothetical protein
LRSLLGLRDEVGEAVFKGLAVLVVCVLGEAVNRTCQPTCSIIPRFSPRLEGRRGGNVRRCTSSLQESRLADVALDVHGLLIDLELRLSHLVVFVLAITLRRCLGSLFILSASRIARLFAKAIYSRFPSWRLIW